MDLEEALLEGMSSAVVKAIDDEMVRQISNQPKEPPLGSMKYVRRGRKHVTLTKVIEHCYHECPHFGLEGGPGPIMVCKHPEAEDNGLIISHPDCDIGYPEKCPLFPRYENHG